MRSATFETQSVLSARTIAEARTPPLSSVPLDPTLLAVAEDPSLRSRSEKLAHLLEAEITSGAAADLLCQVWRCTRAHDRLALRCLMSFFEVRLSGVELLRHALVPHQLLRACRLAARSTPSARSDVVREIVEAAHATAQRAGVEPSSVRGDRGVEAALARRAQSLLERLVESGLRPVDLAWMCELADLELRATAVRLTQLAERVGTHDGRRISRLLPVLSRHEERIRDTRALLIQLPAPDDLIRRTPVIVQRMEESFGDLLQDLAARPEGVELAQAMVLLSGKVPLSEELAFSAAVVRALAEKMRSRDAPTLDATRAILLALRAREGRGIRVDLNASELRATRAVWGALRVAPRSGGFVLAFDAPRHRSLLADDGVPELTDPLVERVRDLRQLALSNIGNEHVLCGLLSQPCISNLPGLVEQIAIRTRSLKILLEIANRRDLHSGSANRNVARALLWHPSAVPVTALRKFVHVRFVDRAELAALAGRGSRARPEIRQLAAEYLASLTTS